MSGTVTEPKATLDPAQRTWLKAMADAMNIALGNGAPAGPVLAAPTGQASGVAQTATAPSLDAVTASLTTDAKQQQAFKTRVASLTEDGKKTALEALQVLYAKPQAADYVDQLKKKMAKLPADEAMKVGKALNELGVYLPNLKPDSPGAEDASARIKKVYMGGYNIYDPVQRKYIPDPGQDDYVRDLIVQGKTEGFKVVLQIKKGRDVPALKALIVKDLGGKIADVKELDKHVEILQTDPKGYVWAEDNKWVSADGTTIRTTPEISSQALNDLSAFSTALKLKPGDPGFEREGHHTAAQDHNDPTSREHPAGLLDDQSAQGAVTARKEHLSAAALAKETGKKVVTTRTYNEGGNMLAGTLPNGQPYGVIGRDGLLVSVFHLEEKYKAKPADVPEFDPANIAKRMKTLTFDATEVSQTIIQLQAAGRIAASATAAKKEEAAKEFLTKIDLTKDIFAADTEIPREQLVFVPQPDFHVDMHMRPTGPGQIMINDFSANIALIDVALKKAKPGSWEEKQLQSMRDHAAKMQKIMGPVIDEIEKQCKKGGLEVTRAPGVMEGNFETVEIAPDSEVGKIIRLTKATQYKREELRKAITDAPGHGLNSGEINYYVNREFTRHVNFMNAIPATKDGTNEQYYMTNYTSIEPLRQAFEEYLKGKGFENVHWIGDHGGGGMSQSTSEVSLNQMGGLDCRENH